MNNLLRKITLFACGLLLTLTTFAQTNRAMDDVMNAIKSNRIQDVNRYLDNFVPITINNNQGNYSHNQAQLVLNDFFSKNPLRNFAIMNTGAPTNTSLFTIADFTTPNGKYNVYVLMRQKDNSYVIKEIRINKE